MFVNKPICDDEIFARLTELFGDTVPTEIILKTGQEKKWKCKYRCYCVLSAKNIRFDSTSPLNDFVLIDNQSIRHGIDFSVDIGFL